MSTRRKSEDTVDAVETQPDEQVILGAPLESSAIFGDENKATGPDPQAEVKVTLAAHYGEHLPGDEISVPAAKAEQLRLAGYALPA